ncbi:MAG: helix-turn-helix domain-containing protein [Clostridia bacterium]|nr:helix-turn-helix domain-containing protein [Clostridia bacterium]
MSIGSTIKRLRRQKNITQEQLAEYLGITSRAVSQWECDRTAPDISQIPALCHVFDVSSDILLGIDIEKNDEEIKKYLTKANELGNQGKGAERTVVLREANKKFPRDFKIMERLADSLVCEYSRKGVKEYDEVFELCKRILAECTDSNIRYEAIDTLGTAYGYAGKKDEMLKLAEEMPKSHFSYENFMLYRWNGDADFAKRQSYISYLINQLISAIGCTCAHRHDDGIMIYSAEERMRLHHLQVALLEILFPEKDYQSLAQDGEIACGHIAITLIRNKDIENAWKWIEKSADFAVYMDTYDFNAVHTSPVLRGYIDGGWIMEAEGNRSRSMLEWLTNDDEVAVLRSDARYEALVKRLKQVARKP